MSEFIQPSRISQEPYFLINYREKLVAGIELYPKKAITKKSGIIN